MPKNIQPKTEPSNFNQGTNVMLIVTVLLVISFILNLYLAFAYRDLQSQISTLKTEILTLEDKLKGDNNMTETTNPRVKMETTQGEFIIELYPKLAPTTVNTFLEKVNAGKYDGLIFHRIVKNFMIQGGCPKGDGTGGNLQSFEGSTLSHAPGVISMAATRGGENQSDMQFFIMHGTSPHLDGQYTAFGKVVEGYEVVDKIANLPVKANAYGENSTPLSKISILKVSELKP